jgi:hypothetical protein
MIIYAMKFYNFSGKYCVNVKLLISISCSLSKVFCYNFFVTTRKVEIPEACLVRDRAGRQTMRSITS